MATAAPARALPLPESVGTLAVGAAGDAVVLALREGTFTFRDGAGEERTGNRKLEPAAVVRAGRVYDAAAWRGPRGHDVDRLEHAR
jgi:dihydroorotase